MTALSAVFAALAVWCCLISPLAYNANGQRRDSNADEEAQLNHLTRIASGRLPVFRAGDSDYEAHQPPLYYVLTAPALIASRSLPPEQAVRVERLPNILLGACLIWAAYLAVVVALPGSPMLAVGVAAFVGLLPMNVLLSASITNDVLTNLIVALGLWRLACLCRRAGEGTLETRWRVEAALLGSIMGIGVWCKTSATLLFPTVLVAIFVLGARGVVCRRLAAKTAATAAALGLAIGAPWLIRNTLLYGDPVAQHIFVSAFQNTATTQAWLRGDFTNGVPVPAQTYWQLVGTWTFESFWFKRGLLGAPALLGAALFTIAAAAGAVLRIMRASASAAIWREALLAGYAALIMFNLAVFVRFNGTFFQAQGRYLYPSLVPLGLIAVAGLGGVMPPRRRIAAVAIVVALLLAADIATMSRLSQIYSEVQTALLPGRAA